MSVPQPDAGSDPVASAVDGLPPQARFALRAVAAGLAFDEAAEVLRLDGADVRKHLRTAIRETGGSAPPPSEGDEALAAALRPAVEASRRPSSRAPGTRCPEPDVLTALALGRLDGPLLLAEAEHAADCPRCMTALVAARRTGAMPTPAPAAPRSPWPVVIGTALGLGAAVWWLFGG